MLTPNFTIKRGEVGKTIQGQFLDANDVPIDCRGNTLRKFLLRRYSDPTDLVITGADFVFITEATGEFRYTFTANDLNAMQPTPRGDEFFRAEFEVQLPLVLMKIPTDPERPFLIVKFEDDLRN